MAISAEGKIGIGLALAGLLGTGVMLLAPETAKWVGWILVCISVVGVLGLASNHGYELWGRWGRSGGRRKMISFLGMVVCLVGFGGFATWHFWPTENSSQEAANKGAAAHTITTPIAPTTTSPEHNLQTAATAPSATPEKQAAPQIAPRAMLIVEYLPHNAGDAIDVLNGGKAITVRYKITNIGDRPAILQSVVTNLYLAYDEPDPKGPSGQASRQDNNNKSDNYLSIFGSTPVVINPGESKSPFGFPQFFFLSSKFHPFSPGSGGPSFRTHLWFLAEVRYADVNNKLAVTSYYVQISGNMAIPARHEEYNFQK